MDFTYPLNMHFPQKHYHNRAQARPHEKEFQLFLNTKINVTRVGTEKENEKLECGFRISLDFFLTFLDKCFG